MSVTALQLSFGFPVIRTSAVGFERAARRAARRAADTGDETPLQTWRDEFYGTYRDRLPQTDLDLLIGDMWIWGPLQCAERVGLNLHPALPGGPAGGMWFEVVWDLVEADAMESGAMLHVVTPEVDLGPLVAYTRYSLRTPDLVHLWAALPRDSAERAALIAAERALKRDSRHPLFTAIRAEGVRREGPLLFAVLAAAAAGEIVVDHDGARRPHG
jgi:phosphoribosylglycinamide formyltransferase-1